MTEEKRRGSAGRVASAIALPEWSLRRKLALALTIPMLLAATFGGLRVQSELSESDNYSATAKHVTVLRPAADYLAAAEKAIITSRLAPVGDPARDEAVEAVRAASERLDEVAASAELSPAQQARLDTVQKLSGQLRESSGYVSAGQAVSQVRQLQRGVTSLIDAIVNEQSSPEPKLAALQQALDGRVSLAMQQYQVAVGDPKAVNTVDLAAELGVEQVIVDRLGSYLGNADLVQTLNQQNAARFGVIRSGRTDLGGPEAFAPYDELSDQLLTDIDNNLTSAANEARALAIANAVITVALLLAAVLLALFVSRMLLNPIRRVREGALEIANERLPAMVAKIRAGEDPGEITPIPVTTHEEMGQLARAVDDMNRQAVTLASGEAKVRQQVGEMFSTLSRRNNSLINQQLSLIERLERDEEDPNRLESLFRLDHLASRMRRTADSLMVLADAPVAASDTDALALGDVFQAAMAGVQEYQRVQIESAPADKVAGAAASDLVHLMTELVDNALAFSPPTAPVRVLTRSAGDNVLVEVSDGGLGIAPDVLEDLNADLRSGGDVTPDTARRMGLLVVSRLAERHGLTVSLARNERGGTTATVLVPAALLRGRPGAEAPVSFTKPAPAPAATAAPSPAPAAAGAPTPKQRPGLASLTSAKGLVTPNPVAPATPMPAAPPVTPSVPVATTPSGLPQRGASAAPATPAAPKPQPESAPAAQAPVAPAAPEKPAEKPAEKATEPEVDPIAAAINAVTRLPQRSPGATRGGDAMPGAPVASTGGSLFQRLQARQAAEEGTGSDSQLPQREPAEPTQAFAAIESEPEPVLDLAPASVEELQQEAEQLAGTSLAEVAADAAEELPPVTPVTPPPAGQAHANGNGNGNGSGSLPRRNGFSNFHALNRRPAEPEPEAAAPEVAPEPEPETEAAAEPQPEPGASWLETTASTPAPQDAVPPAAPAYDLLDSRSPLPASADEPEETPLYRSLRSRWLSADGEADSAQPTWSTTEIEAGWEAAEQVAEAPPVQVRESGLPMRRPGNRLVPGGVAPTPTARPARDPEAIRARLAAHAAGVNRGRSAAVTRPAPVTHLDPSLNKATQITTPGSTSEEGPA